MIYISGEVRNQVGERSGFRVAYVTKSTEYGDKTSAVKRWSSRLLYLQAIDINEL
jgi:hypothetical protein